MLIKISTQTVRLDPGLMVYEVELQNDKRGMWRESFGCRLEVERFLRGVEASFNMATGGFLRLPLIPNHSNETTDAYTKDPE
jgi:hypothetical protein